jgi:hypothetical protein
MSIDDFVALLGLISLLAGVFLWLGLPASLILFGVILIYVGVRLPPRIKENESNQATD